MVAAGAQRPDLIIQQVVIIQGMEKVPDFGKFQRIVGLQPLKCGSGAEQQLGCQDPVKIPGIVSAITTGQEPARTGPYPQLPVCIELDLALAVNTHKGIQRPTHLDTCKRPGLPVLGFVLH